MNKNIKTALIIAGIVLAILIVVPLIWGGVSGWRSGWGMMGPGMMGGFGWGLMPVVMLLFWGLVIWGIVVLVRGVSCRTSSGPSCQADSALEILKSRYVRGEIGKEEFEQKKKDLI